VKKILIPILVAALFIVTLAYQARFASATEYLITVDTSSHHKFGLYYPVTYKFNLPSNTNGLVAQFRYSSTDEWKTLSEKKSTDIFNGIDAVRFDYASNSAYVSVKFNGSADNIYLRFIDAGGKNVDAVFNAIPKFYDDRKAAVTITLDDWGFWYDTYFKAAIDYLIARNLYFTVGVITASAPWNTIQQEIDQHGDHIEVASHGMNHLCSLQDYIKSGYEAEVIGSRDAIRRNLMLQNNPYVPVWVEPCGLSDPTLVSLITSAEYLVTRSSEWWPAGAALVAWDPVQGRYGRDGMTFGDSGVKNDINLLSQGNALFDRVLTAGAAYHLASHPSDGLWLDGSYLLQHLDYISGRSNVWYVPFGQLYLYHFLAEMRGNLTIRPIENAPVAKFSATPLSGASPLSVTFTDASTGSITGWQWDFGDSTTSAVQNPTHVYAATGTYTVKVTVTGPGGTNTSTHVNYIVVNPVAPVANFSATPLSGTAPLSVTFADSSTGSITGWQWDFGDTATSTLQNPVHVYTAAGSYTVKLTVTGPAGTNTRTQTSYLVVNPAAPVASFTAIPLSGASPLSVTFTDSSTGSITDWLWDFGDTATSTLQNPVHVYAAAGFYTVKLTVTGPGGTNTKTQTSYIVVNPPAPAANFTATPLTGTSPLSVTFTDGSTGSITGWRWDFGDTATSTSQNPVHVYAAAGTYTVRLTVTGPGGTNTKTQTGYIVVNPAPPVANFSAAPVSGRVPLSVTFTDSSTGSITSRMWDFGDTATSTSQNPVHVYAAAGSYTVKLTVTGPGGTDTKTQTSYIVVNPAAPVANFSATPLRGAAPLSVTFTDSSTGSITGWLWDFGDTATSTLQNPVHRYTAAGFYTVKLTVTGPGGTNIKTQAKFVHVMK
jgi:PKD repeat protein